LAGAIATSHFSRDVTQTSVFGLGRLGSPLVAAGKAFSERNQEYPDCDLPQGRCRRHIEGPLNAPTREGRLQSSSQGPLGSTMHAHRDARGGPALGLTSRAPVPL
jgi:hypothetical protein